LTLLDPNISRFTIKWKGLPGALWKRAIPEIFDEKNNLIGKIDLKGRFNKKIWLFDSKGTPVLTSTKLWKAVTRKYDVKDENDKSIGIVKPKKIIRFENLSFFDHNDHELLKMNLIDNTKIDEYSSGVKIQDFELLLPDGKIVVKVTVEQDKTKKGRFFLSVEEDRWIVDVIDKSTDRKMLLGFLISYFSSAFDSEEGGRYGGG